MAFGRSDSSSFRMYFRFASTVSSCFEAYFETYVTLSVFDVDPIRSCSSPAYIVEIVLVVKEDVSSILYVYQNRCSH